MSTCTRRTSILYWMILTLMLCARPSAAADLTDVEMRWLRGIWPVVVYAKDSGLPLDLVVQPQPAAGEAPFALAFVDGRCKFVLTLRGSDEGRVALDRIPATLRESALELMAAHELGHCRRHLDGAWLQMPTGFKPAQPEDQAPGSGSAERDMRGQRREEAYADLVGLAWVRWRHADQYAALQAWLVAERSRDRIEGSPHDTLAWIRHVADPSVPPGSTIFQTATTLWHAGLDVR
ncbi:MAG: hypothetical protein ABI702_15950 [Burkholderiales bacterium]